MPFFWRIGFEKALPSFPFLRFQIKALGRTFNPLEDKELIERADVVFADNKLEEHFREGTVLADHKIDDGRIEVEAGQIFGTVHFLVELKKFHEVARRELERPIVETVVQELAEHLLGDASVESAEEAD